MNNKETNKRIAKNTILLYLRMFITMGVGLFTSRIVLRALGVSDFGIYNVVGGIVVLFSFLNSAMSTATQRFLNFELGRNDLKETSRVFSVSMTTHLLIAFILLILGETIGLWFLNAEMNIPSDRIIAANWVYQFSIFTFCANIIRVPYNATIIAYERMNFYAYLSIIEVILKLLIVYILLIYSFDKLIFYSLLIFVVTVLVSAIYQIYCSKVFETAKYHLFWDKILFQKILSFSGWSMFGSLSSVGSQQGLNILLNIFGGVTVNAAVGIANQVTTNLYAFISNFQIAFNPQIVKLYAADEHERFMKLIFRSSKFSFYLMLVLSIPVIICLNFILKIWLGPVPEYTAIFCKLIIIFLMIDAISAPLWLSVQATGNIRNYQIIMSILIICNLPMDYLLLKFGYPFEFVWIVKIIINVITYIFRISYLKNKIEFPIIKYFKLVVFPAIVVTILAFPIPYFINTHLSSWEGLIITTCSSIVITVITVFFIGLDKREKTIAVIIFKDKINQLF